MRTLLACYDKLSSSPTTVDHTRYGASPANARRFLRHYLLAAHSAAVTHADADVLLAAAASRSFLLTQVGAPA